MKKMTIAVLIGAIIMFLYQALSWMALPVHDNAFKFAPSQDSVLQDMSGMEEGVYSLPMKSADATKAEEHEFQETRVGKPWAVLFYHPSMEMNMGKTMAIWFLINFVPVWMFVWILVIGNVAGMRRVVMLSLVVAVIIIFNQHLMNMNWFSYPMHFLTGEMADTLISWLLVGCWVGWFLNRGNQQASA